MSARFDISETPLGGLHVLLRKPISDRRGCFERLFCSTELKAAIGSRQIVQINWTRTTRRGTVRGMHFQHPPHTETKFVTCLRGEVFDVAVDLRAESPTFLRWHAEILSAANHKTLLIPEGFAHGFQTLTDDVELLYLHTAEYRPDAEDALNVRDPAVGIQWPEAFTEVSERDATHPFLIQPFTGLAL